MNFQDTPCQWVNWKFKGIIFEFSFDKDFNMPKFARMGLDIVLNEYLAL